MSQVEHVVQVKAIPFAGWVYDLTTESGDFFANGILIHNCFQSSHRWAYNFCPHAIIDHSPVSPAITSRLHTAFRIIVVSRFAQRELAQAGFSENVRYIPHGVDTQTFRPLENRAECKKLWFIKDPDDFTVLFIGRNQSRKMIPHVLRAYKLFRDRNPDVKSHMLLWTDVNPISREQYEGAVALGVADVGVNLLPEIMNLGLGEVVLWPDAKLIREGLPDWAGSEGHDLVKLYGAADVVISLSGEGFWLPGLEAQSCGVPIICADYGAAPEICGAGLTVDVQDYVVLNTPGTRYPICSLDRAAEALTKIMNADREKLAKKARTFAQRFDWNVILERYWKPFLDECEVELKPLVTKEGVKPWD